MVAHTTVAAAHHSCYSFKTGGPIARIRGTQCPSDSPEFSFFGLWCHAIYPLLRWAPAGCARWACVAGSHRHRSCIYRTHSRRSALGTSGSIHCPSGRSQPGRRQCPPCRRGTGDDVLSIWAPSVEPEGTSVSSWGSSIDPGAGACRAREQAKTPVGLIRPGGSPPRPRRTWAAGRTAALATEWPFQRRGAAGR